MISGNLGVYEVERFLFAKLDERIEGDFRSVGSMVKHGLAEKCGSKRDAVESADEFSVLVGFEGVS